MQYLELKPKTGWVTPLQADTIFGHLCWKIVHKDGEEVLEGFLENMANSPIFVLSNVFPKDFIPKPVIPDLDLNSLDQEDFSDKEGYLKEKEKEKNFSKQVKFIKLTEVDKLLSDQKIKEKLVKKYTDFSESSDSVKINLSSKKEMKNKVNRLTGSTEDDSLFNLEPKFYFKNEDISNLWLLLRVFDSEKFEKYNIKERLQDVFREGYGKKKNVGKGNFESLGWSDDIEDFDEGGRALILSNFVPSAEDPTKGTYRTFMKYGKLGAERSTAGSGNFHKKPILMLKEGAYFRANTNLKNDKYLGKIFTPDDEVSYDYDIYHYAFGLPIFFS